MSSEGRKHVIEVDRLPGGENAVRFDGFEHGAGVSFFLTRTKPATGPDLHRHPYEETFIVQDGEARFVIGESTIDATAGRIVVAPANTPHKFVNTGKTPLRQINIHPVSRMETEWLE